MSWQNSISWWPRISTKSTEPDPKPLFAVTRPYENHNHVVLHIYVERHPPTGITRARSNLHASCVCLHPPATPDECENTAPTWQVWDKTWLGKIFRRQFRTPPSCATRVTFDYLNSTLAEVWVGRCRIMREPVFCQWFRQIHSWKAVLIPSNIDMTSVERYGIAAQIRVRFHLNLYI